MYNQENRQINNLDSILNSFPVKRDRLSFRSIRVSILPLGGSKERRDARMISVPWNASENWGWPVIGAHRRKASDCQICKHLSNLS